MSRAETTVTASRLTAATDRAGLPRDNAWDQATAIRFDRDWQGKHADSKRATEVRMLWTPDVLFFQFVAHYRTITVFDDAEPNGRRDHLWDRDVAEVFLQPAGFSGRNYKEFEVSPNGFWIDLDITPNKKYDLKSGLTRRVEINKSKMTWSAELALPMKSLTRHFDPRKSWRANFYRVEDAQEPRFYSAWRPTNTPVPNFHVPEAFGELVFEA